MMTISAPRAESDHNSAPDADHTHLPPINDDTLHDDQGTVHQFNHISNMRRGHCGGPLQSHPILDPDHNPRTSMVAAMLNSAWPVTTRHQL